MAEDDEELAVEEQAGDGGKKKKLILIGVGVLVLLLAVGGGAYWFLMDSPDSDVMVEEGAEGAEGAEGGGLFSSGQEKAIYHTLKPKFITTFEANRRQRYVQLEVTLVTRDSEVIKGVITHQPLIRNALVLLIAEQDYLALQTQEGKTELRAAALAAVQDILSRETGIPGIEKVLFTEFVMQ
jgi:flagellar FliL protein